MGAKQFLFFGGRERRGGGVWAPWILFSKWCLGSIKCVPLPGLIVLSGEVEVGRQWQKVACPPLVDKNISKLKLKKE